MILILLLSNGINGKDLSKLTDLELCDLCFSKGGKVSKDLKGCSFLLKQERDRWLILHGTPSPDKVTVVEKETSLELNVVIDDGIKNEINSHPISRKYTLVRDPWFKKPIPNADIYMAASMSINAGWRPSIGIGFQPPIVSSFFPGYRIGVGVYTTGLSIGGDIYVIFENTKFLSAHLMLGCDWTGKLAPGIGVGVSF